MSSFTRGPWKVDSGGRTVFGGAEVRTLATVGSGWLKYQDEDDANARLIAAAPSLLEALQQIASGTATSSGDVQGATYAELNQVRIARAAIAKATGDGE